MGGFTGTDWATAITDEFGTIPRGSTKEASVTSKQAGHLEGGECATSSGSASGVLQGR